MTFAPIKRRLDYVSFFDHSVDDWDTKLLMQSLASGDMRQPLAERTAWSLLYKLFLPTDMMLEYFPKLVEFYKKQEERRLEQIEQEKLTNKT